jgi:lysophospholipase L1-like esterase
MVNWIRYPKRFLVVGTIPGTRDELAEAYGTRYVDLRTWLIADGLTSAGVPATPDDIEATATDQIPPSLFGDGTHFTQAAYTAIGHYLASIVRAQN